MTTTTDNTTHPVDAAAAIVADLATRAVEPIRIGFGHEEAHHLVHVVPDGAHVQVTDLEATSTRPRRATGTVRPHDVPSFVDYVKAHHDDRTTVWLDPQNLDLVAVLDDHVGLATAEPADAGWGQHRAHVRLLTTPEWQRWSSKDGDLMEQEAFAELIEDSTREIVEPDAATMLELAQSFHAQSSATFRQAKLLSNGRVQMQYDEDVQVSAGETGQLTVPSEFTLAMSVFPGETAVPITARLRYRLSGGKLRIGFKLDNPHRIIDDAVDTIATRLRNEFPRTYLGTPRAGA